MTMTPVKQHAKYLFEHYKQSGPGLADELYRRIIKQENLKLWQATALKNEFKKLLKGAA